jgi:hypothetical protein
MANEKFEYIEKATCNKCNNITFLTDCVKEEDQRIQRPLPPCPSPGCDGTLVAGKPIKKIIDENDKVVFEKEIDDE